MRRFVLPALVLTTIAGCSSSPYNPINQSEPIRAMDSFFSGGRTDAATPPFGYHPQRETEVWVRDTHPRSPSTPTPVVPSTTTPVVAADNAGRSGGS